MAWFDKFVGDYISEGFSLMAIDSRSGKLVGVVIFTKCSSEYDVKYRVYQNIGPNHQVTVKKASIFAPINLRFLKLPRKGTFSTDFE